MIKELICIECPSGCVLFADIDNGKVISVTGNKCLTGEDYAKSEVENPVRILTSTVLAYSLPLKMIPVRTDRPIPKAVIFKAMEEIKKVKIIKPVCAGDVIVENFLDLKVNLVATRDSI